MDEINAAGGVLGKQIRLITQDDQSKADDAVNAVNPNAIAMTLIERVRIKPSPDHIARAALLR